MARQCTVPLCWPNLRGPSSAGIEYRKSPPYQTALVQKTFNGFRIWRAFGQIELDLVRLNPNRPKHAQVVFDNVRPTRLDKLIVNPLAELAAIGAALADPSRRSAKPSRRRTLG